jgi:hypothetical protein
MCYGCAALRDVFLDILLDRRRKWLGLSVSRRSGQQGEARVQRLIFFCGGKALERARINPRAGLILLRAASRSISFKATEQASNFCSCAAVWATSNNWRIGETFIASPVCLRMYFERRRCIFLPTGTAVGFPKFVLGRFLKSEFGIFKFLFRVPDLGFLIFRIFSTCSSGTEKMMRE